jgi:hypothetical protein
VRRSSAKEQFLRAANYWAKEQLPRREKTNKFCCVKEHEYLKKNMVANKNIESILNERMKIILQTFLKIFFSLK